MQRNPPGIDRRRHFRFQLPLGERRSRIVIRPEHVLLGSNVDVSAGGLKMKLDSQIPVGQILKCELGFSDVPVLVPTLMQTRWCQEASYAYLIGLRFVV